MGKVYDFILCFPLVRKRTNQKFSGFILIILLDNRIIDDPLSINSEIPTETA